MKDEIKHRGEERRGEGVMWLGSCNGGSVRRRRGEGQKVYGVGVVFGPEGAMYVLSK